MDPGELIDMLNKLEVKDYRNRSTAQKLKNK